MTRGVRPLTGVFILLGLIIVSAGVLITIKYLQISADTQAPTFTLTQNGQPTTPIYVSNTVLNAKNDGKTDDSDKVLATAESLRDYLQKITNAPFKVEAGNGTKGIVVGIGSDFTNWPYTNSFQPDDHTKADDYALESHAQGIYIAGATPLAVDYAVWDLLGQFGYRYYFPTQNWEIIPSKKNLQIAVKKYEHPDFITRQLSFSFSNFNRPDLWGGLDELGAYNVWAKRNRMDPLDKDFTLAVIHSYDKIIADNKAEFDRHPEYLAKNPDGTASNKFCTTNRDLQTLVGQWAVSYFDKNPNAKTISLEPSDGPGRDQATWGSGCGSEDAIPTSNRVVTLANAVAEMVTKKYPDKNIVILGYNLHSEAPTIKVNDRVISLITTAYNRGNVLTEQLPAWANKVGRDNLGLHAYFNTSNLGYDLPKTTAPLLQSYLIQATSTNYLKQLIPYSYNRGARYFFAQNQASYGISGFGQYFASRLLWNIGDARATDQITDDFLTNAFGSAKAPMKDFYTVIGYDDAVLSPEETITKMYTNLAKADSMTSDQAVKNRINDLILYTRYTELFNDLTIKLSVRNPNDVDRAAVVEALNKVERFGYHIRLTQMVNTKATFVGVPIYLAKHPYYTQYAAQLTQPVKAPATSSTPAVYYNWTESNHPWKDASPVTESEIQSYIVKYKPITPTPTPEPTPKPKPTPDPVTPPPTPNPEPVPTTQNICLRTLYQNKRYDNTNTPVLVVIKSETNQEVYRVQAAAGRDGVIKLVLGNNKIDNTKRYSVYVKPTGYLAKKLVNVSGLLTANYCRQFAPFVYGDFDGDNKITYADLQTAFYIYKTKKPTVASNNIYSQNSPKGVPTYSDFVAMYAKYRSQAVGDTL